MKRLWRRRWTLLMYLATIPVAGLLLVATGIGFQLADWAAMSTLYVPIIVVLVWAMPDPLPPPPPPPVVVDVLLDRKLTFWVTDTGSVEYSGPGIAFAAIARPDVVRLVVPERSK